jgi:SAM-dependent methyltransferase
MDFNNSWSGNERAESYADLGFPNTYYLAYRDLPAIIREHIHGNKAVDFGCGTGRSTRFLKNLGFDTIGLDISYEMLDQARSADPVGIYELVENGKYDYLGMQAFDLVLSVFTFDNIPGWENRSLILEGLGRLLKPGGKMILLDSTPEMYVREWASFTTREFKENRTARTGDIVRTIMLDVIDRRPVDDIYWTIEDYHTLFTLSGLHAEAVYKPLGMDNEPFNWISELEVAPWVIFVLKPL